MSNVGFFFLTRDRDVVCSCPHCKSHSLFKLPEHKREELIELMKLTKDKIHLGFNSFELNSLSNSTTSAFDLTPVRATSTATPAPASEFTVKSSNVEHFSELNGSFSLTFPYHEPIEIECRKCGEASTSYFYHPDPRHPVPFYTGITVTEDFRKVHINLQGYFPTFFNNVVQAHYYMTRIVFNKVSGRITILRPLGTDNKPLRITPEYSKMWNVTFGKFDVRSDLRFINKYDPVILKDLKEKAVPVLVKALQKQFPYIKEDHFDDCFKIPAPPAPKKDGRIISAHYIKDLTFADVLRDIVRKFRFHDLPSEFLDTIGQNRHNNRTNILSRIGFLSRQQQTDLLKLTGQKLPKSIRKEVLKSLNSFHVARGVRYIKSPSNLKKMIETFSYRTFEPKDFEGFYHAYMDALMRKNERNFKDRDKLHEHCETILVNRVIADGGRYLRDAYNQLAQIRQHGADYEINTDLTLRQLHDDISAALRKIDQPNEVLTYTEKEQEIEWSYGPYSFKLAADTYYLIDVGAAMNICVGGYGKRAKNKALHILTVSSPDNPYECCIELSEDMKIVKQAKVKHNERPKEDLLDAIMKWVEEKNLLISTYDLPKESVQKVTFEDDYVGDIDDDDDELFEAEAARPFAI